MTFLLHTVGVVRGLSLQRLRPVGMEFEHCCGECGGLGWKGKRRIFGGQRRISISINMGFPRSS